MAILRRMVQQKKREQPVHDELFPFKFKLKRRYLTSVNSSIKRVAPAYFSITKRT